MRLGDIGGLETEQVHIRGHEAARWNLSDNGASGEEIEFLLHQRVELNAFPSDDLVGWIEGKLEEHGVKKLIPDQDCLKAAYSRAFKQAAVQKQIDELIEETEESGGVCVPKALRQDIEAKLKANPALSWDAAVKATAILDQDQADEDGGVV